MFLSCFTVASNTTGDKTALLGKVPYFVCVSFLIVQHDIRGYLSIDASHNCSIIPLYWIMFCVILAALLSSVSTISTIKLLPSEDNTIAAPFSFAGAAQHLWESTRYGNEPSDKNVPYTVRQHPGCWHTAIDICIMIGLFGVFFIPFRPL